MGFKATLAFAFLFGGAIFAGEAYANHELTQQLGTPVSNAYGRVVKVDTSTKFINVNHFETLIIKNRKGESFGWRFDTLYAPTGFPLKSIAPASFDAGDTWIYVHPHNSSTAD